MVSAQTNNLDAYEYSLKAKYLHNKWNHENTNKAILLYKKVLKIDAKHTESYVGLADCYSFLGTTGFMPFKEAWNKTSYFTEQALQLNDQLSDAHYQLSNMAFFVECNYQKSVEEMQRAIALNANNAEAHQFMSFLYIIAGDKINAQNHLDIALSINPLSQETQFFMAYFHYMTEDFTRALELLNKCLKVNDKNIPAHSVKTICLLMLKRYDEVISYFDNLPSNTIVMGEKTGARALAYTLKKDKKNSNHYFKELTKQAQHTDGFTADSFLFLMHIAMGNFENAFNWISNAIKSKSTLLMLRFSDPLVNPIKRDPRYTSFHQSIFHIISKNPPPIKKKGLLDAKAVKEYTHNLLTHIDENKPYLNADLTLRGLAEELKISPNQLSWLLNESIGKNFNSFINHFRIEKFIALIKDPKNSNFTLLGLAFESGFNSKTVFNTYFKKEMGLTPKEYLQQLHP